MLHVLAATLAVIGTATLLGGGYELLSCSFGGYSCSSAMTLLVAVTPTMLITSIALGIWATVMHFEVRDAQQAALRAGAWIDPRTGAAGLQVRW